jgi:hypothetical protein
MQALLSSARLPVQARSVTEAAMAIFFICIGPPEPGECERIVSAFLAR